MAKMFKRVSTGISELDDVLSGGYIKGRVFLIAGGPGTGKSIMTWQFILSGLERGENGLLISLDQNEDEVLEDMESLGFEPRKYIEEKRFMILNVTPVKALRSDGKYEYRFSAEHSVFGQRTFTMDNFISFVHEKRRLINAENIVIDGISPLMELSYNDFELRESVYSLLNSIKAFNVTTLITEEYISANPFDRIYYLVDGVIKLGLAPHMNNIIRIMQIIKMRSTDHILRPIMFKISKGGIQAFPSEKIDVKHSYV